MHKCYPVKRWGVTDISSSFIWHSPWLVSHQDTVCVVSGGDQAGVSVRGAQEDVRFQL